MTPTTQENPESDWCRKENTHLGLVDERISKRMRCPDCKKNFITFVRECHDPGCYHYYLPKHKKPVKKKRKVSRDV